MVTFEEYNTLCKKSDCDLTEFEEYFHTGMSVNGEMPMTLIGFIFDEDTTDQLAALLDRLDPIVIFAGTSELQDLVELQTGRTAFLHRWYESSIFVVVEYVRTKALLAEASEKATVSIKAASPLSWDAF